MSPAAISITEYTDPACPFAFSAEPHRLRLHWLFGDQLSWDVRLVVLSSERDQNPGFNAQMAAKGAGMLHDRFGMPMVEDAKEAVAASEPACRAVVAARLHAPDKAWALLRALRHRAFRDTTMLDDPALIAGAAADAGVDADELAQWVAGEDVEAALQEDMRLARTPTPAALAMKGKLAQWEGGWRYTCPSYEMVPDGAAVQFSAPGMQSSLTYETGLANLAPELERREEPSDVLEVLRWAGYPLASQEVAEVCGISREDARTQLAESGAVEETVGRDGFWTLPA